MASAKIALDLLDATVRVQNEVTATALGECADAYRATVRVEVTGRAGVGRTALVSALGAVPCAEIVETTAWDRPDAEDPSLDGDVVVLVVLDSPRAADRAAVAAAGDRLVLVLGKADTVADVARSVERVTDLFGPCLPVSTGRAVSGVGAVRAEIVRRVTATRAGRAARLQRLIRDLDRVPELRDAVDEFTSSDEGVRLAAEAMPGDDVEGDALARVRHWRATAAAAPDAATARAALARQRAAIRDWIGNG